MKKRILSIILILVICVSITPSYAALMPDAPPLYIASADCPQEYIDYATENISKFVALAHNSTSVNFSNFTIGTAFSFAENGTDVFYFPIIVSGNIKYFFRVYPSENGFSAVLSEFLVNEIEALAYLTSYENPMQLKVDGAKIVAWIGQNSYEFYEYPENMEADCAVLPMTIGSQFSVKNVKETTNANFEIRQTRDINEFIPIRITEQQSGNNWCGAFCLAAVIRTLKHNNVTAKDMMCAAYDCDEPDTKWGFGWVDSMKKVSKKYSLYPEVLKSMVSNQTLINELTAGRPSILWMKSSKYDHAVVLQGFNTQGTWAIWNPWYNTHEYFSMWGTYLPMTKSTQDWVFSMYGVAHNF